LSQLFGGQETVFLVADDDGCLAVETLQPFYGLLEQGFYTQKG
jgi:hypothetical protein